MDIDPKRDFMTHTDCEECEKRKLEAFAVRGVKSSMLYWYPKILEVCRLQDIPLPETKSVLLHNQHDSLMPICDGDFTPIQEQLEQIKSVARSIGYPLFMRTDEFSGKHNWLKTCFVQKEEDLEQHIMTLFEDSFCADFLGLPIRALVFRKYIPMKNLFVAFEGMPVNPEMRFFVDGGKIICHHWYWNKEAIEEGTKAESLPSNWKEILENEIKSITPDEMRMMETHAYAVGTILGGCWSVDFCKDRDGVWWLIDMAEGKWSYHPHDECSKLKDLQKFHEERTI